ncbi:MAG: hypothetical protein RJA69_674 [Pseudomonadota bacterium]
MAADTAVAATAVASRVICTDLLTVAGLLPQAPMKKGTRGVPFFMAGLSDVRGTR